MIEMWDQMFNLQNPEIGKALDKMEGPEAFYLMHVELNKVWHNIIPLIKEGGIVCINIGDATRTIDGHFQLYSNHSQILNYFTKHGFSNLPNIIWRKQTNSPNKFMGSGMLAPGAYVTLEHEYILIFRKGNKRKFASNEEKEKRHGSSYFWEERNVWFSDVWDIKGTKQKLNNGARNRSGAFPFELAYRLINMFSLKGDCVFDPFLGLGTTTKAAIASARNSIGIEIEEELINQFKEIKLGNLLSELNLYIQKRIENHLNFVALKKGERMDNYFKYSNSNYNFPVMTSQERALLINFIKEIKLINEGFQCGYYEDAILSIESKFGNF
jgi:DNA modification methylase